LRLLVRAPGYALVIVATLAIAIGANTAIFSVVRGVLLRPLPYRNPGELVRIYGRWNQFPRGSISAPEFFDYRAQATAFTDLAACETGGGNLSDRTSPERVAVGACTAGWFPLLGVSPLYGRWFSPD